ncbi:histidine phosphatase family protein [Burkholderia sp. 8Y]|uniref:histidine phosphatase family protein n=1 Tax=Burkholderia sp. 8Y TaxID=2653133 RepID=UPI001F15884E|nr:histidine phosphatase family protein [Burkholderia sp. 8Y]
MKAALFPTGDEPPACDDRETLARRFAGYEGRVIASPAAAACATAGWIAQTYLIDDAFRDIDYGEWRGHSISAIAEQDPEGVAAWLANVDARPHGGESVAMLYERVAKALSGLARDNAMNERCLIVTHAIVVKAVLAHVRREPPASILAMNFAPLSSLSLDHRVLNFVAQ